METKIYIIIGYYLQEAGYKMLRAYNDKKQAEKDLAMIQDIDNNREWKIEEVELFGPIPSKLIMR
ncbi:hypothetical protein G7050_02540 [Dysgonomonas sp. HDW5A]|uniref:hypothetical protein n=1 Tax=Dysgonomonas sp. HDW5A TaxID=2714926 RepID=UPI00140D5E28|nr:hypothetical protein [Dysgonomonas sp. HDW5A]QIK58777.1 hypothetical protein G7050_02540 [Dysgonomonas sp. HDW5A]